MGNQNSSVATESTEFTTIAIETRNYPLQNNAGQNNPPRTPQEEVRMPPPLPPRRIRREKPINCGDIVQCLPYDTLRRYNPTQQDVFLRIISEARCLIVAVDKTARKLSLLCLIEEDGKLGKIIGNVDRLSCTLHKEGPQELIGDGSIARIGSYVTISEPGLEADRTGVVLHIFPSHQIRVQYGHFDQGDVMDYRPDMLVSGSRANIKTRDLFDNWIGENSEVRVINSYQTMKNLQQKSHLPYDSTYAMLKGKIVKVVAVEMMPYIFDCDVVVKFEGHLYTMNSSLLVSLCETESRTSRSTNTQQSLKTQETKTMEVFGRIQPKKLTNYRNCHSASATETKLSCGLVGIEEISRESLSASHELGKGRFGTVYYALWNGKPCALKKFPEELNKEDLLQEATIQSSFKHPNIVEIYGISLEEKVLIMQFVRGADLYQRLWRDLQKSLSIPSLLRMAKQLASAIAYMHEKGFVHGDIKSTNVLVEASTCNAILCDFGSARFLGVENHTQENYIRSLCGTKFYLAPECLETNAEGMYLQSNFKSDVWSLGTVFVEMFTNSSNFFDNPLNSYKLAAISSFDNVKWNNLPKEFEEFTKISLMWSPSSRPTSAEIYNSFFK